MMINKKAIANGPKTKVIISIIVSSLEGQPRIELDSAGVTFPRPQPEGTDPLDIVPHLKEVCHIFLTKNLTLRLPAKGLRSFRLRLIFAVRTS